MKDEDAHCTMWCGDYLHENIASAHICCTENPIVVIQLSTIGAHVFMLD